jgi:hypothetical protein
MTIQARQQADAEVFRAIDEQEEYILSHFLLEKECDMRYTCATT